MTIANLLKKKFCSLLLYVSKFVNSRCIFNCSFRFLIDYFAKIEKVSKIRQNRTEKMPKFWVYFFILHIDFVGNETRLSSNYKFHYC